MKKSEVVAAESVACINQALFKPRDPGGDPGGAEAGEDTVRKHVQDLLNDMIAEE